MSTRTIIRHRRPVANRWRIAESLHDASVLLEHAEQVIVPLAVWCAHRELLSQTVRYETVRTGVLLEPGDDPDSLAADLARLGMIAIRFPSFTDGRGYSLARHLRERHGWTGALMACGDVLRDQLLLLERCGFDTFWLRDDQDLDASLAAFGDFSENYQSLVGRAPLFARRAAGGELR